ncbi:MAG TPA: sulfite exporter TauE/SafE family protein [Azospira sp.]|nr:sulfite exporter TauE/SafE family protein [Azospira sp.]
MHLLAITDLLTMLTLGAALGFFGGLFGIGGGIIAIPFLGLAFGMEQALAQGTSLAMMVPILLVGWWRYSRRHPIPWSMAAQIGLLASLTTWLVADVATGLNPALLRTVFSVFLLVLALRMLAKRKAPPGAEVSSRISPRWMPLVGIVGGACMGLLGVGGGLVATPFFTGFFAQRQAVAQSLSLALVTPCSIIALLTYGSAQRVDWLIGLPLAVGGLFTVSAGVALAHRLPERTMKTAFAWMILGTAIWLLLKPILF